MYPELGYIRVIFLGCDCFVIPIQALDFVKVVFAVASYLYLLYPHL